MCNVKLHEIWQGHKTLFLPQTPPGTSLFNIVKTFSFRPGVHQMYCKPIRSFGISSRDRVLNLISDMSTSPNFICNSFTFLPKIFAVFFLQLNKNSFLPVKSMGLYHFQRKMGINLFCFFKSST